MSTPDLALPLATLLREATLVAHDLVAKGEGASALLSGRLDRDEYIKYLMMLWHIYDTLEQALDRHANHPTLYPTHNPTLLARAPALAADISYFLQVPETSWKTHPVHLQFLASTPVPLINYVTRIREVADLEDPTPLLAHSYVRYLGDLSGGQTVRRILGKAYDLDDEVGLGLAFYAFKELKTTKLANQGEMKRIKEWFREGMNVAGDIGVDVKSSVLEETRVAFELNTVLFTLVRLKDEKPVAETEEEELESKEAPAVVEQTPLHQRTFPISQVVAVIAAVCLTHFILVTGGFTGDKGYQKLLALEKWVATLWKSTPRPE